MKTITKSMKVNFNNLRKQAVYNYESLCDKLNAAIRKQSDETEYLEGFGLINEGVIVIESEEIEKEMNNLRMMIGSIAMVYEEGSEDFADVYDEIFPEDKGKSMKSFNDELYQP